MLHKHNLKETYVLHSVCCYVMSMQFTYATNFCYITQYQCNLCYVNVIFIMLNQHLVIEYHIMVEKCISSYITLCQHNLCDVNEITIFKLMSMCFPMPNLHSLYYIMSM